MESLNTLLANFIQAANYENFACELNTLKTEDNQYLGRKKCYDFAFNKFATYIENECPNAKVVKRCHNNSIIRIDIIHKDVVYLYTNQTPYYFNQYVPYIQLSLKIYLSRRSYSHYGISRDDYTIRNCDITDIFIMPKYKMYRPLNEVLEESIKK